jgi:DNA-binding PadR family transcriptional regulator
MMILGLVRWLQPVHGYDVRRELLSWDVENWANVQPGSIYHALRKLTEEEMLEEVATEQVGARPARTTYKVTPKGEMEFEELLRRYWWEYKQPVDPFLSAFAFLTALPRREAVAALRNRARRLEAWATGFRESFEANSAWVTSKPPNVLWQFELGIDKAELEATWCWKTAERVEAGEGFHADDDPPADLITRWKATIRNEPLPPAPVDVPE